MFLDILFPKFCLGCGKWGSYICDQCLILIPNPKLLYLTNSEIESIWCLGSYKGVLKKVIIKLKFRWIQELALPLSMLAVAYFPEEMTLKKEEWCLVPVPIHPERLRWRGFNQSELLASHLSKLMGMAVHICLKKDISTHPQVGLPANQRIHNLKGTFSLKESVGFKNIILVDDVWTTGSTIKECALVLKQGGAERIIGFTLAR